VIRTSAVFSTRMLPVLFVLATTLCTLDIDAQSSPQTKAATPSKTPEEDITSSPTIVVFSDPQAISGAVSSPAILTPIVCTSDGTVMVAQMVPPTYGLRIVATSSSKPTESVVVDESKVPGFSRIHLLTYSANRSEIALFAEGEKTHLTASSAPLVPEDNRYMLIFDRAGVFQKAIPLDVPFEPMRFGILPSGDFMMTGLDRTNNLPKVAIVGEDGKLVRFIDIELETGDQLHKAFETTSATNTDETIKVLSVQEIVPFGDDLLLVSPRSSFPIVEIGGGTVRRSTSIKLPKDFVLDSIVASDTPHWIAQLSRNVSDNQREALLAEIDPDTGKPLRYFKNKASYPPTIACAIHNSLIGVRIDAPSKEARLMLMKGTY
jgi:hypothetical protein